RQWALEYPQRYQLIFGTPIPGYEAPRMEVMPSAARSLIAPVSVIDKLRVVNKLSAEGFPAVQPGYEQITDLWRSFGGDYDILSLSVAMIIWSRVHGLVSLEISNSMPPIGMDNASLYRYEVESIVRQFVKRD
ncbi:MAG: TetR-like C-terminal domain-containing protein, partial [Anaerolineales bacterium]